MKRLSYTADMIPSEISDEHSSVAEIRFEAELAAPEGSAPYSSAVITATARVRVNVREAYSWNDKTRSSEIKHLGDTMTITLEDIKLKELIRTDGSAEKDKLVLRGLNIALDVFNRYFDNLTVETFKRVRSEIKSAQ